MAAASRKNRFPISTLFEKSILGLSFIWGLLRLRRRPDAFLPFSMFQKVAGLPAAITFQVVTTLAGKPCEVTFVPITRMRRFSDGKTFSRDLGSPGDHA